MLEINSSTYFTYGDQEIDYLKKKDKKLAQAIDEIGVIKRPVDPDLFKSLVDSIVGQQISAKAQITVWGRIQEKLGQVTPHTVGSIDLEELQACGISMRKAGYIKEAAKEVLSGRLILDDLHELPDEEVCRRLSSIKGIGVWTAEMLMLFSMQRMDVFSFGDLAIHRGLRMLYHHKDISRERFERYRRRYSPYGSVASLYLWAIASGRYSYQSR